METVIVSHSYTGNNEKLGENVAKALSVKHIRISEPKARSIGTFALDALTGRTPQVSPAPDAIKPYDEIIFFAPVWMGCVAAPLRAYLKMLKDYPSKHLIFFTVSGGADGSNTKLAGDLKKRTENNRISVLELPVTGLMTSQDQPQRKDTSAYKLTPGDVEKLTPRVLQHIRDQRSRNDSLGN